MKPNAEFTRRSKMIVDSRNRGLRPNKKRIRAHKQLKWMKEHISYFPVNKLSMDSLMQFLDKRERILGERIEIFYKDPMFSDWSNAQRQPLEAAVLHYIAEIRFLRRWLKKHFTD